jgi:broad specificity phosphatase PhoE
VKEIYFVRHGQTAANAAGVWQGQSDDPLSESGLLEVEALGRRLDGHSYDVVVASDLQRAMATAAAAGYNAEADAAWTEIDVGSWEGLSREEVARHHPEAMAGLMRGDEVRLGGGETWQEFCARVDGALAALLARLEDAGRALVVTHGGVVYAIVAKLLGFRERARPWPVNHPRNASVTVVTFGELPQLQVLNDASHLETSPPFEEGSTLIALVRHGESKANVEERWQGLADGPLTDRGLQQGAELARWYGPVDHVYTSHLQRARLTAEAIAAPYDIGITVRQDLHEIAFGTWENLTPEEIAVNDPEGWTAFRERGEDVPRGASGETFADAVQRLGNAVGEIAAVHRGGRVAIVSHGGVIRGLVAHTVGLGHAGRQRFGGPGNASVAHLRVYPDRSVLVDYNLGVA